MQNVLPAARRVRDRLAVCILGTTPERFGDAGSKLAAAAPAMLLTLSLFFVCSTLPAQQADRSKWDTQLPAYPVEAAACAALAKGGTGTVEHLPFKVQGIVPEPNMEITGVLVPRTPLFLFYAEQQGTFKYEGIAFDPTMRCGLNASLNDKGTLLFTHVPDGAYLVLIFQSRVVTWHGVSEQQGHGYDMFGGPVTTTTEVPTSGQSRQARVFSQALDLVDGKVTNAAPAIERVGW